MNFFKITVGTATRKGGFINSVERMIQTGADYSKISEHFTTAYRGFDVKVDPIEAFELVEVAPKEDDRPKVATLGKTSIKTIYSVEEINISLSDENNQRIKEITELEKLIENKEMELFNFLHEEWENTWWLNNKNRKNFVRRGSKVLITDAKLNWNVIVSKVTKVEE